ncbi:hypothetical protein Dsin_002135, partial [Dipteronia sinensis]
MPVSHQYKLLLLLTTTIKELRGDYSSIPVHRFEFLDFEDLEQRVDKNTQLTDVVGHLTAMSTVENQQMKGSSSTCKKRVLNIEDINSIPNIKENVEQIPKLELHGRNESNSPVLKKAVEEIRLMTSNSESETSFRYKLQVNVEDDTESTTFVIFDKEMEKILQVHISKIYTANQDHDKQLPVILNKIVGKDYVFRLKLNHFNLVSSWQNYTVNGIETKSLNKSPFQHLE